MQDKTKKKIYIAIAIAFCLIYVFNNMNANNASYLLYRRIPRLIAMIVVAIAITVSTTLFQTMVNNKILTPDLLGYSSLYVMIQTLLVFLFGSFSITLMNATVNFALVSFFMIIFSLVIFTFILKKSKHNLYLLLLVGTVLNTLFSSVSSFIQMVIDPNEFNILQNSLIASFNNINTDIIPIAVVFILIPLPWVFRNLNKFDVLQLGEDYATNLGIDTKRLYTISLIVISILVSVSTALVGPIVFLGMLVINLSRMSLKSHKHKDFMFIAIIIAIIMVVGGQFIVDKIFGLSVTLPVLLNLIGGIYMIYLIMKERTS